MWKWRYVIIAICLLLLSTSMVIADNLNDSFQFLSPRPGSKFVATKTYIVIRPGENLSNYSFSMTEPVYLEGSKSGQIDYDVAVALDQKTLNIKPRAQFEPGEVITVAIDGGLKAKTANQSEDFIYSFSVTPNIKPIYDDETVYPEYNHQFIPNSSSNNGLILDRDPAMPSDWPTIVTSTPGTPDIGYLFTAYNNPGPDGGRPDNWGYLMILDDNGSPKYFRKTEVPASRFMKSLPGILTWGQDLKRSDDYDNKWFAMNQTYTVIDTFEMIGYELDSHGFQLTEDWHSFMFTYNYQVIDMSDSVEGGNPACEIEGFIIQELDSLKNLVFQWSSWDNLNVMDCQHFDMTARKINATHINGLDVADDGNILISIRGFCECMKINITTGDIMWRLTTHGPNSSFTFVNDTSGFCWQHNMRQTPAGTYTVYDNGCFHVPQFSRVVEYELDTLAWTATLVWEYRPTPDYYTAVGGDAQRLPNGNTMIGFSDNFHPASREVHNDGSTAFEIDFDVDPFASPAACKRDPWTGIAAIPYLIVEPTETGAHLIFYKFGDGSIDEYKIYMGESPNPTTAIDSTLENYYDVTGLLAGFTYYFRVTGVDYSTFESDFSNEEELTWWLPYTPGDANGDGNLIGADVTFSVNYFRGTGSHPPDSCWNANAGDWHYCAADANGDCNLIGSDVTFLVNYFRGTGNPPSWCEFTPPFGEQ